MLLFGPFHWLMHGWPLLPLRDDATCWRKLHHACTGNHSTCVCCCIDYIEVALGVNGHPYGRADENRAGISRSPTRHQVARGRKLLNGAPVAISNIDLP